MSLPVTIKQARKILKADAIGLSDDQIQVILDQMTILANASIKLVPNSSLPACEDKLGGRK